MKRNMAFLALFAMLLLTMLQTRPVSAAAPSMEYWYSYWIAGGSESGNGISAGDVDNDGVIEIVAAGDAWGSDGIKRGSLSINSYDGVTTHWEHTEHWYEDGNTAAHEVFLKDVDNDGVTEILTVGKTETDSSELRIWNWNGAALTMELSLHWRLGYWSSAYDVYAEDVDGDGTVEIITVGSTDVPDSPSWHGQMRILTWDEATHAVVVELSEEWNTDASGAEWDTQALGVCVEDVDDDGMMEIVTVGMLSAPGSGGLWPYHCQLRIWNWNGAALTLEKTSEWQPGPDPFGGNLVAVAIDDLDGDGDSEMVTAGRAHDGTYWNGYLTIQAWDGSTLSMEREEKWYDIGDTEAFGLCIADVDGDGAQEVVTVGALHVTPAAGQLKAFTWQGGVLTSEWNVEWSSGGWGDVSFGYDNCIEDVDGDGVLEILAVGRTVDSTIDHALVTIWSVPPQIPVNVDIKPGSWPNPLQLKGKGVLPVAVCGTEDFDVTTIDPATVELTLEGLGVGVPPLRWSYKDVATPYVGDPYGGHDLGPDGYLDLTLKFKTQEVIATLGLDAFGDGDVVILLLTGNLKAEFDGTAIHGQDCVWILHK